MHEEPTRFAPAERASPEDLGRQAEAVRDQALLLEVLSTVPDLVLVLNAQREVVFANHALAEFAGLTEEEAFGLRPGELMGCVHAENNTGGCGTGEACRTCGSVAAILAASQGEEAEREAGLSLASGKNMDLRVKTRQITVGQDHLTVMTVKDIGHEKRRKVLERIFFHDVLNTAGGVQGLASLLRGAGEAQVRTITDMLEMSAGQLVDEIRAHRLLTAVEGDEYEVSVEGVPVGRVVSEAVGTYTPLARTNGVTMQVVGTPPDVEVETDHTMLNRVLGNLIKNAVEASGAGTSVLVGAGTKDDRVEFWVSNTGSMSADAQLQVFKRSFSTKGDGRGLGTYSVKLFTERYLDGDVSFDSSDEHGTTFRVRLPLNRA